MEFRDYWRILWRRRRVILPLLAITFVASLIFNLALPPIYTSSTTVQILAVIPRQAAGAPQYYPPEYWNTVYSEYISDDLGEVVKSDAFATKVADVIKTRFGKELTAKEIAEAMSMTTSTLPTLKITVAAGSDPPKLPLAAGVDEVLRTDAWSFFS